MVTSTTMDLTTLERAVLDLLGAGEHPALAVLRAQMAVCTVTERKMTGVGFFASLHVPVEAPRLPARGRVPPFGNVVASIPGLANGVGFLLYVEDGVLAMLEGYTFDEPWPDDIRSFTLRYDPQARGTLAALGSL